MSRAARLGAFIVATLAILVAGVFIIGSRQYLVTYQSVQKADDFVINRAEKAHIIDKALCV